MHTEISSKYPVHVCTHTYTLVPVGDLGGSVDRTYVRMY